MGVLYHAPALQMAIRGFICNVWHIYTYGVGFDVARSRLLGRCQSLGMWNEQQGDSHALFIYAR
ncbi:MAG: hypothetical protein J5996_03370 [Prevotella sp.]|nr:hypothetical protein [Prevotella sp.]